MSKSNLTIHIDDELRGKYEEICKQEERHKNELVVEFIKAYVEGYTITYSKDIKKSL